MKPKDASVRLDGLTPEMRAGLDTIEAAYLAVVEMIVTSAKDGHHMSGSKHYEGNAVDLRTHHLKWSTTVAWRDAIKRALGPDYDVVLEGEGTESEHLHVEYQPKPDPTRRA